MLFGLIDTGNYIHYAFLLVVFDPIIIPAGLIKLTLLTDLMIGDLYFAMLLFIFERKSHRSFMDLTLSTIRIPFLPTCFSFPLLVPVCKNLRMPVKVLL
jgi:hypothetical protein